MSDLLVRLFGWSAALIHGNTKTLDRWWLLSQRLPKIGETGERVLEVGCGTGALTMGIAKRGYEAVGLSWSEGDQVVASRRAKIAGIENITFPVGDARRLDEYKDLDSAFDAVICSEVTEHIIDDRKLFKDIAGCLKPGARLILTTPNYYYRSSWNDKGPWSPKEDGGHVRRGYTPPMLRELCAHAQLEVEEITYVTFFFSQLISRVQNRLIRLFGNQLAWLVVLPFRVLPPLLDGWLGRLLSQSFGWPGYSIALVAYKKRFGTSA